MTIKEFIQNTTDGTNLKDMLEIRTYIPIAEKKAVLETVLDTYCTVDDGVVACDYVLKKMVFELAMLKYHTNLDIDITSDADYDDMKQADVDFTDVYYDDYQECKQLLDCMEYELRSQYSIEASIAGLTHKLSDGIGRIVNAAERKISDFDVNQLGLENFDFEQLKNLLGKYGG